MYNVKSKKFTESGLYQCRLETYPKLSLFRMSDPPPRNRGFRRGVTIVNNFFVLRDMNILSKEKMFRINHSFDSQYFRVRARDCARSIQHQFFEITEKTSFFHVFWGDFFYEYFCCFERYEHVFKTKHVQNLSLLRFIVFSSARARLHALDLA